MKKHFPGEIVLKVESTVEVSKLQKVKKVIVIDKIS